MRISVAGKFKLKKILLLIPLGLLFILIVILSFKNSPDTSPEKEIPVAIFESEDFGGFENFTRQKGAKEAYAALKAYFKNNETKAHDFAHVIGFVAAEKDDLRGLGICDNLYNYGCYHGFMQVYLQKHGVTAVSDMEASCLALGEINAPSCLHGIGHGLMMEAGYKLDYALGNCQILQITSRTYCFDGVFMERIAGSMLPADKKLQIKENNLLDPCNQVVATFAKECWRNQVSVWFSYFSKDTQKVGAYCAALSAAYWEICFESIGLLNVQTSGENLETLVKTCNIVNATAHDYCLTGEVKEILFEGKDPQTAFNLCNYASSAGRNSCYDTYQRMYQESLQRFAQRSL